MKTVKSYQFLGIFHGVITIFFGLIAGMGLTFAVIGEVSVWPFFASKLTIPGEVSLWRAAHTGPIMNGVLCIAFSLSLSLFSNQTKYSRMIVYAMIFTCWGNSSFYFFRIFGVNRGLSMVTEKYGQGGFIDFISYIPALLAIPITIFASLLLAKMAYNEYGNSIK
jgi:styrene-oxide isomerase